jgi:hypothetical protein
VPSNSLLVFRTKITQSSSWKASKFRDLLLGQNFHVPVIEPGRLSKICQACACNAVSSRVKRLCPYVLVTWEASLFSRPVRVIWSWKQIVRQGFKKKKKKHWKEIFRGWGYCSVVECLPCMNDALWSLPQNCQKYKLNKTSIWIVYMHT